MKPTNLLLLNLNASCELSGALRGIIESARNSDLRLQQETIDGNDPLSRVESVLPELVSRSNPAVIFLVSSWNRLKQAKSLFPSLRRSPPEPPVVVVSDADAPDEMFEMIKLGAADFITSPLTPTGILPRLWRLLEQTVRGETLAHKLKEKLFGTKMLVGESQAFLEAVNKIPLIAQYDTTVLISGETGTGKEVCARAIHQLSPRSGHPFIAVNCGAIPVELVENELFGHERGAYTHASSSQMGQIQMAEGGTLFLDEIDSLPLLAQVKLLRFLQEKEFKPLGSTRTRHADVRVVTATNVNVEKAVLEGKLRQDLYYRLNILPILLPPLRERREDIPLLAANFLSRCAAEYRKPVNGFSPDAMQKLALHDWPGNVRELEHVVARAVALSQNPVIGGGDIVLATSLDSPQQESFQKMKARVVEQFERTYLQSLLIAHQGNITKAAEAAQKNRRAFFELLSKHGIDARSFKK
ncbi:MAG: sigma-54 interaction domain-containing protein [Blastocatellia bacterium]